MTLHPPPSQTNGKPVDIKLSKKEIKNLVMLKYGRQTKDLNKRRTR